MGEDGREIVARGIAAPADIFFAVDQDVRVEELARPRIKARDRDGEEVLLIRPWVEEVDAIRWGAAPVSGLFFGPAREDKLGTCARLAPGRDRRAERRLGLSISETIGHRSVERDRHCFLPPME